MTMTPFNVASSGSKLSGALRTTISFWSLRFSFPNTDGISFSYHTGACCVFEHYEQPGSAGPNTRFRSRVDTS